MSKYEKGIERRFEYRARYAGIKQMLAGLPPEQQNPVQMAMIDLLADYNESLMTAYEKKEPVACTWYGNGHELFAGMGIKSFNPVMELMFHLGLTDYADAKECDSFPLDDKICSLVRYAVWSIANRVHLKPSVFVAMMEPCDGQDMLHQAFARSDWYGDVPYYAIDPSYGHEDKDFQYVADQMRYELVPFLEKNCGVKYDFDKLAAVCEETNKQTLIWREVYKCLGASPMPLPSFVVGDVFWALSQHLPAGDPRNTGLMQAILNVCKDNVAKHVGPVMNEQVRIFWPDLQALWGDKLGAWLASEWNAVVVNSFQGDAPYELIDTSNEKDMFFGIARRSVAEVPMIRQGRGWVDVFEADVARNVTELNCNAVIYSGHMGHKDNSGQGYFLKRVCRDLDVPCLTVTTSLFDERYTPLDKLQNDISNFLSAAGFKRNKK
ncbi:MAG: 2-hydroxyacyl-CoA dehydratase [Duodenibacillus sp.]|nr:2-hydroxyacyl-CoA dehydratase [Duodenibacillus sp.]